MAKSTNNVVTHGLSGKIGDMLVFSQRGGQTIVGKTPRRSNQPRTQAQQQNAQKFQQAVIYAKAAIKDASLKQQYKAKAKENENSYNIAVADFFNAPDIQKIDLSAYTGKIGDAITIQVTDDFLVKQVTVEIYNPGGTLVEQGQAVSQPDAQHWIYNATATNSNLNGDKVIVKATDLPGNLSTLQENLSTPVVGLRRTHAEPTSNKRRKHRQRK